MAAVLVVTVVAAALAGSAPVLVADQPLPDPQVIQAGGEWCVFGTGAKPFLLHGDALRPDRMKRAELELHLGA